jgi:hypothetical protein
MVQSANTKYKEYKEQVIKFAKNNPEGYEKALSLFSTEAGAAVYVCDYSYSCSRNSIFQLYMEFQLRYWLAKSYYIQ